MKQVHWQVVPMTCTQLAGMFMVWNGLWNGHARFVCRDGVVRFSPYPLKFVKYVATVEPSQQEVAAEPDTGYFLEREEAQRVLDRHLAT